MNLKSDTKPSRFEIIVALFSVSAAVAYSLLDLNFFHPGIGWPDEWDLPMVLQQAREGAKLPLSYATGCLHRDTLWLLTRFTGPSLMTLHVPMLGLFFLENLLLYALGRRVFGARAGLWAVISNTLAAFSLLRLRSILAYSFLPLELLTLLWLLHHVRKPLFSIFLGLAAALMLFDYEAWVVGLGVLGLAAFFLDSKERPKLWHLGLGFLMGLSFVIFVSAPNLAGHMAVRASQNAPSAFGQLLLSLGQGLKGFWLGADSLGYVGVLRHPTFPVWAWLPLVAGCVACLGNKNRRWILAWLFLGLAPLLSLNSAVDPQRAIVAWPALCLLAGAGAAWFYSKQRLLLFGVCALAFMGAIDELHAYQASMKAQQTRVYSSSEAVLASAEAVKQTSANKPVELLTEFDNESGAALRFMLPPSTKLKPGQKGLRLALLPREYCLQKNHLEGTWLNVPEFGPCLFSPDEKTWVRLQGIDAELGVLWARLPRYRLRQRIRMTLDYYLQHPRADVWVKTACLEQVFGSSFLIGELPLDLLKKIEHDDLASASLLLWCSTKLQRYDPAWSLRLLKRAHVIDPSKGVP